MATSNADDTVPPIEAAISSLSDAQSAFGEMDSKYSVVYSGMVDELLHFLKSDRDGELAEAEAMLEQLRVMWEQAESEENSASEDTNE